MSMAFAKYVFFPPSPSLSSLFMDSHRKTTNYPLLIEIFGTAMIHNDKVATLQRKLLQKPYPSKDNYPFSL